MTASQPRKPSSLIKLTDVRYMLIVVSAVFAVGLALLMAFQIQRSRRDTIQDAFHDAENLAINLAQHTHQSFLAADLVLQSLASPDFVSLLVDPALRSRGYNVLRHRKEVLPGVVDIVVTDPQGRLVLSANTLAPPPIDLSQMPAVIAARQHTASGMMVSPPFVGTKDPVKGKHLMVVSRALEGPDGKFLGTVLIVLGLESFEEFYRRLSIGPHGAIGVMRNDGIVILRHPDPTYVVGRSITQLPVYAAHQQNPAGGALYQAGMVDRVYRIVAYRDVPDVNLFVVVGLSLDDVLAGWRRSSETETLAAAALTILIFLLAAAANRLLTTREAERERTIARLNHLAEASADIATVHSDEQLAESVNRVVQYLIPGGHAELRLAKMDAGEATTTSPLTIAAPLRNKIGTVIGSISVRRDIGPSFSEHDIAILTQLAHVVAVAVDNLELLAHSAHLAVQAERARDDEAEARRAMETVFAIMSEAVVSLDPEGRITFLNDNAKRIMTPGRTELLGHIMWEAVPSARGLAERNFIRCFKEQTTVEFEFTTEINGVTHWHDVRAFPSQDGITIYSRDITQRVEAETKLRQAQKMEAIGQLTGGMAHDFNNLLTVVLGSADTLVDSLVNHEHLRKTAESIRDSALRGATLVARLLAFARRQALTPEPVSINDLVEGLEDLLSRTIGENVKIKIKRGDDLWHTNIDPVQMENAILNLALNARDAMVGGGTLTIETRNVRVDYDPLTFEQIESDGDYVLVTVSDTGMGMSPDVVQRAFDPFFTTKPIGQGSGLGLSMVYGFVRQSGGQVRISSIVGEGTAVRLFLPRSAAVDLAHSAPLEQDNMPLGHERILLVEDDELVRAHLAETLSSLGYHVLPCANGQEVLGMIKNGVEADLLLTDIILSGGANGHRVAEQIKELRPRMPVLFMSGYTENAIADDGHLDPGTHFISKPFRRQQIATKLRAVFAA